MRWLGFSLIFILSACATKDSGLSPLQLSQLPPPPYSKSLFPDASLKIEPVESVFELTKEQENEFLRYFSSVKNRKIYPNKRISNYLSDKLSGFNFYSDTLTAKQSMNNQLGNCLSLAIVTHSLAKLAGVKVEYELIETIPIFQREGDVILASQHVQSLLYDPAPGEFEGRGPLWRGFIRIDYYPVKGSKPLRKVKEEEFILMFYLNRAAEAIIENNYALAYAYLEFVLEKNKIYGQAINMMAIIHSRVGKPDVAEALYRYGLDNGLERDRYELLYNYYILLTYLEKDTLAKKVKEELEMYPDYNPYQWVSKGEIAYENGEYDRAIWYFRKAARLADYLHEPYAGIAKARIAMGNKHGAMRAMKKAMEKAQKESLKNLYQIKYRQLSNLQ